MKNNDPIGIFDSGLGGLTVFKQVTRLLPDENIIYFGDTEHVPYGSKSREVITRLSTLNVEYLLKKNVKLVVIACNTTSALSLKLLQKIFSVPIIGVVSPGARAAAKTTGNLKVGVIGTNATIRSMAYLNAIKKENPKIKVSSRACPLFVPIVEEGWFNTGIALEVARKYLSFFNGKGIDTLVLGCTHYPFLKKTLGKVLKKAKLIDSAEETAKTVALTLKQKNLLREKGKKPVYSFYVTDSPDKFKELGSFFLKKKIKNVKKVNTG